MLLMGCQLGSCRADDYRVTINDRTGPELMELEFEQLTWERLLDGVSTAKVTLPAGCASLDGVRSWRHELHISRQGEEVWAGPLMLPSACRSGVTLEARDVTQWLARRVIHSAHCWSSTCGSASIDVVDAALELIRDGFAPDDPNVIEYLTKAGAGDPAALEYAANSAYVLDALNDLAKGGVDYTAVGRRIVVMPEGWELSRTAMLTCDHFQGDVCTTEDGYAAAFKAYLVGDGVTGTYGGVHPYFGLLEVRQEDTQVKDLATANSRALGLVNGNNPPPLLVQPPDGASLSKKAPVCINELVPGVTVPVAIDCTARTAVQDMRLTKLSVTVDGSGETVGPLLTPIGLLA